MENENSRKLNAARDSFIIANKRSRVENNSLNFISNQSFSSATVSSPVETNTLTLSSPSKRSSTDMCTANLTNACLNNENSLPKSLSKVYPADVSQTEQDAPCQPHLSLYPISKETNFYYYRYTLDN
jgi:hypothetical protein